MADDIGSFQALLKNNQEKMIINEQQNKRDQAQLESKIINTNIQRNFAQFVPKKKIIQTNVAHGP